MKLLSNQIINIFLCCVWAWRLRCVPWPSLLLFFQVCLSLLVLIWRRWLIKRTSGRLTLVLSPSTLLLLVSPLCLRRWCWHWTLIYSFFDDILAERKNFVLKYFLKFFGYLCSEVLHNLLSQLHKVVFHDLLHLIDHPCFDLVDLLILHFLYTDFALLYKINNFLPHGLLYEVRYFSLNDVNYLPINVVEVTHFRLYLWSCFLKSCNLLFLLVELSRKLLNLVTKLIENRLWRFINNLHGFLRFFYRSLRLWLFLRLLLLICRRFGYLLLFWRVRNFFLLFFFKVFILWLIYSIYAFIRKDRYHLIRNFIYWGSSWCWFWFRLSFNCVKNGKRRDWYHEQFVLIS